MARDILLQNATLSPDAVPEGFTPAQVLAMGALLSGKSVTTSARLAGVSRSTVHRWLTDDPAFVAYWNKARQELADSVEQSLRLLSGSAVVALRRLLTRRSVPDSVKLQTAVAVLKLTSKQVDGPAEFPDATNAILLRQKKQDRESMLARLGMDKHDLLKHLDRPIRASELNDFDESDDDIEDEELDDEEELYE